MRRLIRIGIGAAAVVVVLVIALVVFVSAADFTAFRTEIAGAVELATGRAVLIKGRIDKRVLTLSPSLVLNDVSFANAKWGQRPQMLTAKRIEISLALWPLLSGTFHVKSFTLVGADVLLETNAKGRGNWEFWPAKARAATLAKKNSAAGAAIQNLHIRDSVFTFHDGRSRLTSQVHIDEITATASSLDAPLNLSTKGTYNDVPISTEGRLGALSHFLKSTKNFPIDLKIRFGNSDLALKVKGDLGGRVPAFTGTVTSRRLDIDQIAAATARASGRKRAAKAATKGAKARKQAGELPLGILGMFDAKLGVKVATLVAGRNPFHKLSAKVDLKDGDLRVTGLRADLTNGHVEGSLRIDVRTPEPKVAADLKASRISLAQVTRAAMGRPVLTSMASATARMTGHGRSIAAITRSLEGPVALYIGGGPIHQGLFNIASTDVLALFGLSRRGAFRVVCGVFPLRFRHGVGYGRNLVLDTSRITLYGRGAISLPRRWVDMVVVPAGKGVSLTRIAGLVPFRIRGPLARPSIAPDPKGVPTEVVKSVLGAVALPGDIAGSLFGGRHAHRRGCGARKDVGTDILKAPGKLLRKPGNLLKKLNPFH